MVVRDPTAATSGRLTLALALALGFTLISGVVITWQVRNYYVGHLPHFDSIGSYFNAYAVMNAVSRGGFLAGLAEATAISLGWLQPLYALALSWLPARSPEWLVSLNFLVMALAQGAIALWCRDHGYGWRQATVLMLLPYVPGAFYAWDGGLQDWRRDIQLNVLLIAVLFVSLAYVQRPSLRRGLAFGALLGLSQWSRDNAVSMLLVVVAPAAAIAIAQAVRARRWRLPFTLALAPAVVFLVMVVPYLMLTIRATIARYIYLVWGPGEDRWASLRQFWSSPVDVLLGGTGAYNGQAATGRATLIALGIVAGVLVLAALLRVVRFSPTALLARRSLTLTGSGLFVIAGVIVYNTLGLGYGAQYHGMPFVSVAAGLVALAAGFSDAVRPGRSLLGHGDALRTCLLLVSMVGLLGLDTYRVRLNEIAPVGIESVNAVRDASVLIAERAGSRRVAVLWLQGFSRYHITYYQSQANQPPLEVTATEIDGPLRPGQRAEDILAAQEAQINAVAAVVVVCEDTSQYANPAAVNPMFQQGQPLVERILANPTFEIVHRFTVASQPLVVLQRRTPG